MGADPCGPGDWNLAVKPGSSAGMKTVKPWAAGALAVAAVLCRQPALAQSAPGPVTTLHLTATGTVQATPDQLVAVLVAQNTSASVADAQRRVNEMMAGGVQAARAAAGVEARATGYQTAPVDPPRSRWEARQTLELRASDGPALLDLVNTLQRLGFATAALEWQVSAGRRRAAMDEAAAMALKTLQDRAAQAARVLGLQAGHIRDVRLQERAARPVMPMAAFAERAAGPPPQATGAPEDVTVEAVGEVELVPALKGG